MKKVYMDHASATPVRKPVVEAMLPYFEQHFGNPSAVYDMGSKIKQNIEEQRAKVATLIGAKAEQIIFTSSGAEANNLAIKGISLAGQKKGNHIIVSAIEHHSVLNSARFFERMNFEVTFLPVDEYGLVDPERLRGAIRPETILVSVMHANNEIGTIEPIAELALICKEKGVIFHTDAVATVGNIPVDVNELNVDLLSLSGASLGAPKGVGALYIREGVEIGVLMHGGGHERGLRSGTENIAGIVGFAQAVKNAKSRYIKQMNFLRDKLIDGILEIPKTKLNGPNGKERLCNNINMSFTNIEGESIGSYLEAYGICSSTGSACSSHSLEPSHVLKAIGLSDLEANTSVRLSLSKYSTLEEVEKVLEVLPKVVEKLRKISPFK